MRCAEAVTRDAELERSKHDMGGDIVPWFVDRTESAVYDYKDNDVPGSNDRDRGYWRDVGTMRSYYDAHMDLVAPLPVFNLYNNQWPIYTSYGPQPPAKLVEGHGGEPSTTFNSILSPGVVVTGGAVQQVGALAACCVESGAEVSDSVLLPGVRVGRGRGRAQRDHRQERRRPAGRADRCRSEATTRRAASWSTTG